MCRAGARPATCCSSRPAAITTTSASTRGSRATAAPQPDGVAGLHHVAIRYPSRAALADALRRVRAAGMPIRQASDHGTHEAIYLSDPDGNDLELMWDRPFDAWPRDALGHVQGRFGDLDLDALAREGA